LVKTTTKPCHTTRLTKKVLFSLTALLLHEAVATKLAVCQKGQTLDDMQKNDWRCGPDNSVIAHAQCEGTSVTFTLADDSYRRLTSSGIMGRVRAKKLAKVGPIMFKDINLLSVRCILFKEVEQYSSLLSPGFVKPLLGGQEGETGLAEGEVYVQFSTTQKDGKTYVVSGLPQSSQLAIKCAEWVMLQDNYPGTDANAPSGSPPSTKTARAKKTGAVLTPVSQGAPPKRYQPPSVRIDRLPEGIYQDAANQRVRDVPDAEGFSPKPEGGWAKLRAMKNKLVSLARNPKVTDIEGQQGPARTNLAEWCPPPGVEAAIPIAMTEGAPSSAVDPLNPPPDPARRRLTAQEILDHRSRRLTSAEAVLGPLLDEIRALQ